MKEAARGSIGEMPRLRPVWVAGSRVCNHVCYGLAAFLAALTGCRAVPFQRTPSARGSSWQRSALQRSPAGAGGRDILELGRSTFGTDKGERPIAKTKPGSKAPFEERFQSLTNSR
jgi:hypothetical protein